MIASLDFSSSADAIPLTLTTESSIARVTGQLSKTQQQWVEAMGFTGKEGQVCFLQDEAGNLQEVVAGVSESLDIWGVAHLPDRLPAAHTYTLNVKHLPKKPSTSLLQDLLVGWALEQYSYRLGKVTDEPKPMLIVPKEADGEMVRRMVEATILVRDLVNAPPNIMHPEGLQDAAEKLAKRYKARISTIIGEDLLKQGYPLVHTVGRGASVAPRLMDLRWGNKKHPKVTLIGKGVCFDSGGLDIKSSTGMKLMKKDMGGAAHVLGLAQLIMDAGLPVRLRVLVPAVENAIDAEAFRTSDVLESRKGSTVEIGNTDAEGRLILADALYEADQESPDLLIDCATLTGAARIATGSQMPAFFTPSDALAKTLDQASNKRFDPLWRLPLHAPYQQELQSKIADIKSTGNSSYGGAITAALFLQHFIEKTQHWVHVDMMAWNLGSRPGRPSGGEAMGLRALFALVCKEAEVTH